MCVRILLLLSLLSHSQLFSQSRDSLLKVYNMETIYRYGNKFLKGSQKLSYSDLRLEFDSPSTMKMYAKSRKRLFISRIFNVASLGGMVASVVTKTDINGSIKFALGTGILGLGALYYQSQSSKYLEAALWERNRDKILRIYY